MTKFQSKRGAICQLLVVGLIAAGLGVAVEAAPVAGAAFCAPPTGEWVGTWSTAGSDQSGSFGLDLDSPGVTLTSKNWISTVLDHVTLTDHGTTCDGQLHLEAYQSGMTYALDLDGTLSANGGRVTGSWSQVGGSQHGTWTASQGSYKFGVGGFNSDSGLGAYPADPLVVSVGGSPGEEFTGLFGYGDAFVFSNFGNPNGYVWLNSLVDLRASLDTLHNATFTLDASVLRGMTVGNIGVDFNGGFIGNCDPNGIDPYGNTPCVAERADLAGGDALIRVITKPGVFQFSTLSNPKPEFFAGSGAVAEGSSVTAGTVRTLQIPVTLSSPLATTAKIHYSLRPGTAGTTDYVNRSGTLTFRAGQTEKIVAVKVVQDDNVEGSVAACFCLPAETFDIVLDTPVGAALGRDVATQSIIDDDDADVQAIFGPGTFVTVGDASIGEGDGGVARAVKIPVNLSAPLGVDTDVFFSISGSATPGTGPGGDYTVGTGRKVHFRAGQVNKIVTLKVIPDTTNLLTMGEGTPFCAGAEGIQLTVTSATNGVVFHGLLHSSGTMTICNDD
ncbi:MAG: Calx-beta domain-containing protein [Ilumatobacteraceae bacterium]